MAEKDQGAKAIIQLRPADFIQQVLPEAEFVGPLETDVATESQLMLDTLYRIRLAGVECAVNIEIQAAYDKDMPQRLFEYGTSAMRVHKLPAFTVVLWLQSKGHAPASPYRVQVGTYLLTEWHFFNVEMRKLSASAMITTGPLGLLPFVPFMQGTNEQFAEQAMQRVKEQAPSDQQDTLALILAVFIAEVYKSDDLARAIVRRVFMSTDLLKDSPLYQSLVREAVREARMDAKRELAQAVLERRFGPLSQDVLQALNTADETTLSAAGASDTLEQARAHLGLQ